MDLNLTGKRALVTGATAGIGRAIALGLAAEGAGVAAVGRRASLLDELREEALRLGAPRVATIEQDMLEGDAATRIHASATAQLGEINILVNCAGGSINVDLATPDETWEQVMTLNWERHRQLTGQVLPAMQASGWGRIVNITGRSESMGLNASVVAKSAVHAWSKSLVDVVAEDGITVNCLGPGRIDSEQISRLYPPERRAEVSEEIPAERFGRPEEVADLAVFLASPRAGYINGTVIHVDGGARRYLY